MSARDALPTGLALGARHAPDLPPRRLLGAAVTLLVVLYATRKR